MSDDKILAKVAKLLERGHHPGTPQAEKESCLEAADKIMSKYALDMALVEAKMSEGDRRKPIDKKMYDVAPTGQFDKDLKKMLFVLARANRVRTVWLNGQNCMHLFGLHEDVLYVEMVWTNIVFDFLSGINPSWDHNKTFEENVYILVKAAYKWREILEAATSAGVETTLSRLKPAYHRHQKKIGEEQTAHTQSHTSYRESYAMAFANRVCERLYEVERQRTKDIQSSGTGSELVFVGHKKAVDDLLSDHYPKLRSSYDRRTIKNPAGSAAGVRAGNKARITRSQEVGGARKVLGS